MHFPIGYGGLRCSQIPSRAIFGDNPRARRALPAGIEPMARKHANESTTLAATVLVLACALWSNPALSQTGAYAKQAVEALGRRDCADSVDALNKGINAGDAESLYWAGRLLDRGTCVKTDHTKAASYFAAAAKKGNNAALMEFGALVGLGETGEQSYKDAGDLFRAAGLDSDRHVGAYTLGYAGTLRRIAEQRAFDLLPSDLLNLGAGGTVFVEYRAASGDLQVRPGPQFAMRADPPTGTNIRHARLDVVHVVKDAWQQALAATPKPDRAQLEDAPVSMSLDLHVDLAPLENSDVMRAFNAVPGVRGKSTFSSP